MPPPAIPESLLIGYRRFRRTRYAAASKRYRRLGTDGQRPAVAVIACSDSRSAPDTVFDAGPGELFVIRNIAGLVPPYEPDNRSHGVSAALEYAVLGLDVRDILVLGHGRCGGIAAALDLYGPLSDTDFVGTWVRGLRELATDLDDVDWPDPDARRRELELRSVERSIDHLRSFPWICEREAQGTLGLHGAWFDIAHGELEAATPGGWTTVS
jgi:carbonic anhydrase